MRVTMRRVLLVVGSVVALMVTLHLGQQVLECQQVLSERRHRLMRPENEELVMMDSNHVEYRYSKEMPLIFIGGVPRSGTTLMRAMLDAHPEVRCGEETRIIPRVLAMRQAWSKSGREKMRLDEAGVTDQVLDAAMQAFILEVIAKHGEPARYLCNKDPFTLKSSVYLSRLFPNSKFLLMVRDGRASVHSMITRKVTIAGFDLNSYRDCLTKWNKAIEVMYSQCLEIGRSRCLPVYYEQLVLHPEQSMHAIMKFLDISWSDTVLHHEELIGKPGGVSLSKKINGPGYQASEHGGVIQMDRAHPRGCAAGHGPHCTDACQAWLRPLRQPTQLRPPRPLSCQQHTQSFKGGLQNASQFERSSAGDSEHIIFSLRKLMISRMLQMAFCCPTKKSLQWHQWKSVIQAYCLLILLPK